MAYRGKNHKGGRPKGKKNASTLKKELVLQGYRARVMQSTNRLLDYQFSLAKGTTYLFKIEKELIISLKGGKSYRPKKPQLVENVNEIQDYLEGLTKQGNADDPKDPGATYYYITAKDPDGSVINSMLDRTYGKPTQAVDMTTDGEKLEIFDESQFTKIAQRLINAGKPGSK